MQYIKIRFTFGLGCDAYQEIENGNLICIKDVDGNVIDISDIVTESHVIDDEPPTLDWFIP